MPDNTRLIVLESPRPDRGRLSEGIERQQMLSAIAATGAKLRHDSGGRLLVIELSDDADETLRREVPGVSILDLDEEVGERVSGLDPSDSLFLRALAIRNSREYRERKSRRRPGETPEEQLLFTAPCLPEG